MSCLSCAYAEDLNEDEVLMADSDDLQELEVAAPTDEDNAVDENESQSEIESQAYLVLDNDADKENIYVGDYVTWIVSVINEGPDTAKNVKVYDQLPDGLKYVSHTLSKGTFDYKTGIWDIGDLAVSEGEVFLNITVKALTTGEKINKANLTTDSHNLNINESYEEEEIDVFEHEAKAYAKSTMQSAGNPIALAVLSIFLIFAVYIKYKK